MPLNEPPHENFLRTPLTTAGLSLEGALARYSFSIDEAEAAALQKVDLDSVRVFD